MTEYRAILEYDDFGTDIGDWLPQDKEHYDRVGPFCLDDGTGTYVEVDWETWWADPESHVENWVSFIMALLKVCPCCGATSSARQALGGLDYLSWKAPYTGEFSREELVGMDPYLVEVFDELVADVEYEVTREKVKA